ncbi:MAG: CaiB/BaiF CoA transferase family protein [Hasllibacter sp.]
MPPSALDGLVILDLTRILAGPTATQMLADLGAEVWKVENPATAGDDTRGWGPPFAEGPDGPTDISAYFACANRGKKSVAIDIATPEGQAAIRALAARADVVMENFKPGGLAKYGLDWEDLRGALPGLVWCTISGYGRTGPNAHLPGYDLMAQGFGGIMSLTGEPGGMPMKVGTGVADIVCGLQACIGVLAALRHRDRTGEGQLVEIGLVDSQMSWLVNEGTAHLMTGDEPIRRGNGHPQIVPYQVFDAADGHLILACGNDAQFARTCDLMGLTELAADERYRTNAGRVRNRETLLPRLADAFATRPRGEWLEGLAARKVPAGPVNTVPEALATEQAAARGMVVEMARPDLDAPLRLLGNPLKLSATPVAYRRPPPRFGEDTEDVLSEP